MLEPPFERIDHLLGSMELRMQARNLTLEVEMAVAMLHSSRISALRVGKYHDRQHERDERLAGLQGPGPHQPHARRE